MDGSKAKSFAGVFAFPETPGAGQMKSSGKLGDPHLILFLQNKEGK